MAEIGISYGVQRGRKTGCFSRVQGLASDLCLGWGQAFEMCCALAAFVERRHDRAGGEQVGR